MAGELNTLKKGNISVQYTTIQLHVSCVIYFTLNLDDEITIAGKHIRMSCKKQSEENVKVV